MTDVIEIGKEQAIALLDRALEEKGESYVYESSTGMCVYADQGAPSCIVGHALAYAGVPVENLVKLDHGDTLATYEEAGIEIDEYSVPGSTGIDDLNRAKALEYLAGVRLTFEAQRLFYRAQVDQDFGKDWGYAVKHAKGELEDTWDEL